ncbi:MAG: polysaccharide biosynthesis tyrosine autokinase [Porphyrobacter sp.]|nr:polysaccharide biosynthesis tyrosine autokinase [Porphyrobacter sp.]
MNNHQALPPRPQRGDVIDYGPAALAPYVEPEADDDFDAGISIMDIFGVLWARKWWVLLAGLIGLLAALAYSLSQTPMYRATAVIELNPPTVPILSNGGEASEGMVVPTTDFQFQETQIGILRSRALAERVVQDLDLTSKAAAKKARADQAASLASLASSVAEGLTVRPSPESRLVELSYEAADPREAALLANSFATSFVQLTLDRKYEATTAARKFLEERIKTVREDINDSERELVAYAKANGIVMLAGAEDEDGAGTSTLTGDSLGALNAALATAQQKRITAEQRFRQSGALTEGSSNAATLRGERAQLEAEYREKSTYLQDSFPEMARLKSRIGELDRQIRNENARATGSLGAEYRAALAEEQALRARVAQLSGSALSEREDAIQYNILKRELDTSRSLYDALLERYNEVGVVEGIGTAQAALVDKAEVPQLPFSPPTLRNAVLGVLLGLLLGGGIAVLFDRVTNTVKTRDDVREKLGIPALGVVPISEKGADFLDQARDKKSRLYDAYATLRSSLEFSSGAGFPGVLLVTSARPGEGKSSTSYSLGVQLADVGLKVLLIDGDMRKPSFFVAEEGACGLSSLLTSHATVDECIVGTTSPNLFLMPSGPIPPNPANIILPSRLKEILDELRGHFDAIILDAPPVGAFADAGLLGTCCDGVLFTVECGKTRTAVAQAALYQLRIARLNVVGAVLTKASGKTIDYGYGYGYSYYYNSGGRGADTSISVAVLAGDQQSEGQ